jgi:hypothetical protein
VYFWWGISWFSFWDNTVDSEIFFWFLFLGWCISITLFRLNLSFSLGFFSSFFVEFFIHSVVVSSSLSFSGFSFTFSFTSFFIFSVRDFMVFFLMISWVGFGESYNRAG